MVASFLAGSVRSALAALAFLALAAGGGASAQSQPTLIAIALAKEIIAAKATSAGFDSVGPSVIERAKNNYLQLNPALARDLNEIAAKLKTEYAPRFAEPLTEAARVYASKFSEQELKDILAFYKSPTGKKVIVQEPVIIEESLGAVDRWAQTLTEEIAGKFRVEMKKKGHDL
jgi:hypothetical protein